MTMPDNDDHSDHNDDTALSPVETDALLALVQQETLQHLSAAWKAQQRLARLCWLTETKALQTSTKGVDKLASESMEVDPPATVEADDSAESVTQQEAQAATDNQEARTSAVAAAAEAVAAVTTTTTTTTMTLALPVPPTKKDGTTAIKSTRESSAAAVETSKTTTPAMGKTAKTDGV